jgi:chitin disaccharide deacetylase
VARHRRAPLGSGFRLVRLGTPRCLAERWELTASRVPELPAQARLDDVAQEFRAQLAAVCDAGLRPTHLHWHCLADGGRDDIFELTVALAAEQRSGDHSLLTSPEARRLVRQEGVIVTDYRTVQRIWQRVAG